MEKRYLDMGSVGMHPKGAYDKSMTYSKLQLVTYRNNTYLSKQDGNIGHEPVGEDEWWSLIVDAQTAYEGATSATAAAKRANDAADNAERINAEVQKAEDLRIASEQERTTAETARDKAEQARQGDENLRKTAEENRASAETGRSDAEQRRDANETSRESAEQMRKSDEADRIRDEKEREATETSRKAAERERTTAEQTRQENETTRVSAETERILAELSRQRAEAKREQAAKDNKAANDAAVDAANAATAAAETATDKANTAATNADAATDKANTAADGASKVNAVLGDDHVLTVTDRTGTVKTADLGDVSDVARIKKSLGPYSERPDINLTAKETNVAISAEGVKVNKSGWAMAEFTAELGNEYLFKPGVTDGDVCVFAEYIDKVERRAIEYTYTYDDKGRIATAKATYEGKTHSYSYAYQAQEGSMENSGETCIITDDQTNQTVDYLPATFQTTVGSYQPMTLLNADAELPEDGYCRFVSNFQSRSAIKVVVSYKVDAADLVMKVVRDGMTASMCTQLSKINQKVDETKATAEILRKKMALFGDAFAGFARVSGDADPKPSDEFIYGNRKLVQEIGKHMKIGTVKRVGNEAVLQHEGAPGRITKASNGDVMAVDGSEGDLLVYTDIPLYLLKANEQTDGFEMSCMGVGVSPCYWQGHAAKRLEPFAFAPFYTVNAQIFDDERSCAHCIISDTVAGTPHTLNGFVKESFRPNANGYFSTRISSLASIHNAQAKNADPNTNRPYMGGYYEFYELWMMMMYIECGTLDTTDLYCMGVGVTQNHAATADTWNNERIAATSGVKMITADGTVAGYAGLMLQSMKKGADGKNEFNLEAVVGNGYYGTTKCGEALMVLDGITKAGLQGKVGSSSNVFYFDDSDNLVCSSDINLDTGEGMTPNKRYFVVRDVPNCQGIGEGVLTAVVNTYAKFSVADGIYTGSTDLTGGTVIYKFSHSVYRGMSIPLDGAFIQLSGAHYISGRTAEGTLYGKFICAEKWQDIAPLTDDTGYGDIDTEFNILKGLNNVKDISGNTGWVSKADYSLSLFCFTEHKGAQHIKECRYTMNNNELWGCSDAISNKPATGKEGVKALLVGNSAIHSTPSACSAICDLFIGYISEKSSGSFAVPQLKLK